jgi:hypothetical protein
MCVTSNLEISADMPDMPDMPDMAELRRRLLEDHLEPGERVAMKATLASMERGREVLVPPGSGLLPSRMERLPLRPGLNRESPGSTDKST